MNTEPKLKSPQAKVVRPQAETQQLIDVQQFDSEDQEADAIFDDIANPAGPASSSPSGAAGARLPKDAKEKEKKKPWYKEYVEYSDISSGILLSEASLFIE